MAMTWEIYVPSSNKEVVEKILYCMYNLKKPHLINMMDQYSECRNP